MKCKIDKALEIFPVYSGVYSLPASKEKFFCPKRALNTVLKDIYLFEGMNFGELSEKWPIFSTYSTNKGNFKVEFDAEIYRQKLLPQYEAP